MLVDANILVFAVDTAAAEHERARDWLEQQLNGDRRVGLPWESLTAFVRLVTNPRAFARPLAPSEAWDIVEAWLAVPVTWVPGPTERHATVLGDLVRRYRLSGNLVPDAHLAAIALEHGAEVVSADTDFARFTEVRWSNPLAGT
jgi:toxin-antitoxin system PIN domain toxin